VEPITHTEGVTGVAYEEGNYGLDQSMCQMNFTSHQDNYEVLSLKMHTIGSTPVQIITHHYRIFSIEGSPVIHQRNFNA
jgi:hypothetical protein